MNKKKNALLFISKQFFSSSTIQVIRQKNTEKYQKLITKTQRELFYVSQNLSSKRQLLFCFHDRTQRRDFEEPNSEKKWRKKQPFWNTLKRNKKHLDVKVWWKKVQKSTVSSSFRCTMTSFLNTLQFFLLIWASSGLILSQMLMKLHFECFCKTIGPFFKIFLK